MVKWYVKCKKMVNHFLIHECSNMKVNSVENLLLYRIVDFVDILMYAKFGNVTFQ